MQVFFCISKDRTHPVRNDLCLKTNFSSPKNPRPLSHRSCFCVTAFLAVVSAISPLLAAEKITYDDHVFPIFEQACLNCHNPDKAKGGLDLSSFSNTMKGGSGGKIAEPGDTSSSLLESVMRTGELTMPPEGDPISPAHIATLKAWIEGGLLENKNSAARKPSKPQFNTSMSSAPGAKPEGPPPLPLHVLLEPLVAAPRGAAIHAIAAAPWAPMIAVTSLRQICLYHSDSLELIGILPFPEGEPTSLAFTPDSRYLIVGGGIAGKSGTTVTFDVTTGARILTAAKEFDSVLCADIRPGFDVVATGSPSKLVKLWNTQTTELQKSIKKHTDWVTSLDISPDGILLATGDRNGGVLVWEADTGGEFHALRAHQAAITHTAYRNDSNILGSSSEDGTVRMWEMNGGTEIKKIDAHGGGVIGFDWTRDGHFVTAGRDLKAKIWKPDFNPLRDFAAVPALPTAIAVDAEGKRAFVGDINGLVHVFQCDNGALIATLQNNPPAIATRITQLEQALAAHPESITVAQKTTTDAAAKLEEHKKIIAAATTAAQQSKDAVGPLLQQENEIKAKLEASRQALAAKKTEAETLRPSHAPALALVEQSRTALATAQGAGDGAAIATTQAALTDAEGKLNQITQSLAALDATVATLAKEEQDLNNALAPSTKAVADAQAKVAPAEADLKGKQDALAALEKNHVDAQAHLQAKQTEPLRLKQAHNHWTAAAINAKALAESAIASTLHQEFEHQTTSFTDAAKRIDGAAAELNALRQALAELTKKIHDAQSVTTPDPTIIKLMEVDIKTKQQSLSSASSALQKAEAEMIEIRQTIEQKTPERHTKLILSSQLKADYLRQLEQKIE